jgi:endoglucanase
LLLQELSEAFGVSGQEQEVRDLIYRAVKDLADDLRVDAIGNLIAAKKARRSRAGQSPWKVMIAAHMDEVGFMITGIEGNGALRFQPVGSIDPRVVLDKRVVVGKDRLPGVIGSKPIHLQEADESRRVIPFDKLAIDVGAANKDDAEGAVKIGDYAAFATPFQALGSSPTGLRAVMGKALDDRAGCAMLIELLKGDYAFDLSAVFTVQEEVGLRGAGVAAYAIEPQAAFVLETTVCDDLPKKQDISPVTRLGAGTAISIMDRTAVAAKSLVRLLIDTAVRESIPHQIKSPNVGGTDAGPIHLARAGVPTAVVSTPCRYLHAACGMMSLNDWDNGLQLMQAALQDLTPDAGK